MPQETMKVLIAHHRWWYPTSVSGADIANHEFAKRLSNRGIEIRVHGIVSPETEGKTRARSYVADGIQINLINSEFLHHLEKTIHEFRPDVVITSCPEPSCGADDIERMMDLFRRYKLPVVLYVHDLGGTLPLFEKVKHRLAKIITNSHFMSDRIKALWFVDTEVVYPVPGMEVVDSGGSTGPFITFFNPQPHKGLSVAHSLVMHCFPERPFLFVEGFIDPEAHGIALSRSGNLVHARRSPSVAAIYSMTKTLIVPSQWEEPFGRVVLEAMYNKIPVISSKTGGLCESVGDGGILIEDFENVDRWVEAIEALDDAEFRQSTIDKGQEHISGFDIDREIDKFVEILKGARGE